MKRIIACLFLVVMASTSLADRVDHHHDDQDKARDALERGEVAQYSDLEQMITDQFMGRIIRVELDRGWFGWLYKLRLLEDDGRVIKIEVNARNLEIIEIEGRQLETIVKIP